MGERDPVTFGQRVVAALVPRYFKDLTALHVASGKAYSTVHDWASGKSNPRLEVVEQLAELVRRDHDPNIDALDILRGSAPSSAELTYEPDDRYPSRAQAIRLVKSVIDPDGVAEVRTYALHAKSDPGVVYWLGELAAAHRRVTMGREDPKGAEADRRARAITPDADEERDAREAAERTKAEKRRGK